MSLPSLVVPLATLVLIAALSAVRALRVGRPRAADVAWLAVPAVLLAAVAVWCTLGLYTGGLAELVAACVAALLAAATALGRERALTALRRRLAPAAAEVLLAVVALLVCTVLAHLALELPYNPTALSIAPGFALIQLLVILAALVLGYFLFQRHGSGLALGVGVCFAIGLAQFFVAGFKASAILPNDLFVLGTAAAVSGSYVYSVDGAVLLGLACLLLALPVCMLVAPAPRESSRGVVREAIVNLGCSLVALTLLWVGVSVPSYFDDLGVGMEYWYTLDYYEKQGFLTTFIAVAQDLPIEEPEGYTDDGARELEARYAAAYDETLGATEACAAASAQFADVRPSIVCVMNETFADLSALDGGSWGYEGPARFRSLGSTDGSVMTGELSVSVIGGGTCNSEFEFLTGVPLAYVGDGKYPYSLYDLSEAPSLARQLGALGYDTTAIHPNFPTNWNRDRVYEMLGFDRFLSFDAFDGAAWFHSGVSDAETYDEVLEILRSDDDPQLVFDVTMQNHSSYDQGNIGDVERYEVDGVSDYDNARLSEYLGCIEESDRALADFVAELAELDRPVVLVFFGDHQPALSTILADALYPGEAEADPLSHTLRTHETSYLVWANYDVAGAADTAGAESAAGAAGTSPAYLWAQTAEAMGVPLTDYQKALLAVRAEMPELTLVGARSADGTWCALTDEDALPAVFDDLAQISYLEFASKLE
ncbi:LTA synthase family protein [Olsenella profusa]|uniref:Sulfatase-like hydrolase/transferase n=1 Tax=Olsenella profusa TaxID=138595 RepID=A0ABS2F2R9_9ACTN|nr:LTA synthase family protein [Olsenella profusa]MBM6774843.1 sulfatase-like hydrolase/transferase [Olsenella profusa]